MGSNSYKKNLCHTVANFISKLQWLITINLDNTAIHLPGCEQPAIRCVRAMAF